MKKISKKLGVIVSVDGSVSQVGMYSLTNDSQILWYGDILTGPKIGAFVTINQNDVKIIATISSEKIMDQQNTVKSAEFDNRYKKDSINRILTIKTKGVIENKHFQVTSQYVPMVGNEVTITTKEELDILFGIKQQEAVIYMGKSILEGQPINLPINPFFASHIGVFGNTGSGKSNTLHKLYLQLFSSQAHTSLRNKSQFYIIDFNGEYVGENTFGILSENKSIFEIKTNKSNGNKIPIKKEYLFDADILSILFDARPATQVPFLRKAINTWNEKQFTGESFAKFELGLLESILTQGKAISPDAKDHWISVSRKYINESLLEEIKNVKYNYSYGQSESTITGSNKKIVERNRLDIEHKEHLKFNEIKKDLEGKFDSADEIEKLQMFLEFQKVYVSTWENNKTQVEYLNPLFNRIETAFASLSKVIEVVDDISEHYKMVNIISLVHANQEITRLIPMLVSKMVYDEQKKQVAGQKITCTKHLIIDEAHNILNNEGNNTGDSWQDYRLSIFEEIIKEGRKFGFYLTLSSQRPADISSTILSQVHNYFIHRLVNEKDLRMLENTMPTLDKSSYQMIPSLGKGEAIITGNAMQVPVFIKVEKEEKIRPSSDDIILTDIWN